jgi:hypothetical protein
MLAGLALLAPLYGQMVQVRRAAMRGDFKGEGRCTLEVLVDGVAEVEVLGDLGRIRTYSGEPSTWQRFDCNAPMPRDPVEFHLQVISGRGHVQLLKEPRQNGGAPVARIEDPQPGRSIYAFELIWRGGRIAAHADWDRPFRAEEHARIGAAPEAAVNACKDAAESSAKEQFNLHDFEFRRTTYDDRAAENDRVIGSFDTHENGTRQRYSFTCRVDGSTGQIRSVLVSPTASTHVPGRPSGEDPIDLGGRAVATCRTKVAEMLKKAGYTNIQVRSAAPDARPGHDERVMGHVAVRRDARDEVFNYYCSADFSTGAVHAVSIEKR